jgi:hypothetical protein
MARPEFGFMGHPDPLHLHETEYTMSNIAPLPSTAIAAAAAAPLVNTRLASYNDEDYFGPQKTSAGDLPDPRPLAENLARSVMEILAGARELDQISRWVTDEVYRHLITRVQASARARALKKIPIARPVFSLGNTLTCHPVDGVCEAVVVVHGRARSRSIAIRLEGLDGRWRAAAIHVL